MVANETRRTLEHSFGDLNTLWINFWSKFTTSLLKGLGLNLACSELFEENFASSRKNKAYILLYNILYRLELSQIFIDVRVFQRLKVRSLSLNFVKSSPQTLSSSPVGPEIFSPCSKPGLENWAELGRAPSRPALCRPLLKFNLTKNMKELE